MHKSFTSFTYQKLQFSVKVLCNKAKKIYKTLSFPFRNHIRHALLIDSKHLSVFILGAKLFATNKRQKWPDILELMVRKNHWAVKTTGKKHKVFYSWDKITQRDVFKLGVNILQTLCFYAFINSSVKLTQ